MLSRPMIRIDALWLCAQPQDMRVGGERRKRSANPILRRCRRCAEGGYAAAATTVAAAWRQLCGSSCPKSRSISVGSR